MSEPRDDAPDGESRRGAVIGLVVVLALVVIGYLLVSALRENAELEDCLMSGRKNCASITTPARQ